MMKRVEAKRMKREREREHLSVSPQNSGIPPSCIRLYPSLPLPFLLAFHPLAMFIERASTTDGERRRGRMDFEGGGARCSK